MVFVGDIGVFGSIIVLLNDLSNKLVVEGGVCHYLKQLREVNDQV